MSTSKPESHKKPKTRKKPKQKAQELDKSWSMFPALHSTVSSLLEENDLSFTFFEVDENEGSIESHDTNIVGRFRCLNQRCSQSGWGSKVVAITIRMYPEQKYNARVYHQRCRSCGKLSQPLPDDSYSDRVAYRLKKWSGIEMTPPPFNSTGKDLPHESALCEGCKHGHCRKGGSSDITAAMNRLMLE